MKTSRKSIPLLKKNHQTHRMDHLYQKTLIESQENVMSGITNPNSIYIKGKFKFSGYKIIELDCYVDTGASLCIASKHVIPEEHWDNAERPIKVKIADGSTITITKVCKDLEMQIAGEIFHIAAVYQQESGIDFIIGNNFCQVYEPFVPFTDRIIFTLKNNPIHIGKIRTAYKVGVPGFLESMKKKSKIQKPEAIKISPNKIFFNEEELNIKENESISFEKFMLNQE